MKTRTDASNFFSDSIEIEEAERFLREKRRNGYPGLGLLHLFIASYIRVVAQYPAINRFISGQRVYARNNIEFVMIIKREMKVDAAESTVKMTFDAHDTITDVYNKLNAEIEKVKAEGDDAGTDSAARALLKIPRFFLRFAIGFLSFLDYFGRIPKSLMNASPFHGSVIITDLGSIGLPAIYHHLYNFGNLPAFISIGSKRKTYVLQKDGTVAEKKVVDYRLTVDERICDGFYLSQIFKLFKAILLKPGTLDEPIETVAEDVD